jgi:DNA-binding transcriptional regulator LsrR (DeoR family)
MTNDGHLVETLPVDAAPTDAEKSAADPNAPKGPQKKAAADRFHFDKLPAPEQRDLLERFATSLKRMLEDPNFTKERLLEELNRDRAGKPAIDIRQFDNLLRQLHGKGYLSVTFRELPELAQKLLKKYDLHQLQTVVAGSNEDNFALAAAEAFVRQLVRIGEAAKRATPPRDVVRVGIVSGRTSGAVVRAATGLNWRQALGADVDDLPRVELFALNVCLTVPDHLANNATILVSDLAKHINRESREDGTKAKPYGLSAPLWVRASELQDVDETPQTFEVVRYTEPYRVREKLAKKSLPGPEPEETRTELDLVLTGVGEPPPVNPTQGPKSIWFQLAEELGFRLDEFCRANGVVGDIAFTAISASGAPIPLLLPRDKGAAAEESMFYSAVSLKVLQAMATDPNKSVILVARQGTGAASKVPAVRAFLTKPALQGLTLVVDEATALGLS